MGLNINQAIAKTLFMSAFTVMPLALFRGSVGMFFVGLAIFLLSIFTFHRPGLAVSGSDRVRGKKINHNNMKRRLHV